MARLIVLGSGGPLANPRRASSGFVLSGDSGIHLLVDAGGGVFERLGRTDVAPAALDPILLTHLHVDHSGGLAPVLFSATLERRGAPTTIAGPAPRGGQPGCARFAELLFGRDGAWRYLNALDGFAVEALEAPSDPDDAAITTVIERPGLTVRSVAVPHGPMPSLSYRVELDGRAIVFSGDVERYHRPLVELAGDCDLLVHELALPERDVPHSELHAKPSEVGRVARDCRARRLLCTHVMPPLEDELDAAVALVRSHYDGEVAVAHDLAAVAL